MAKRKFYRYPLYLLARTIGFLIWILPRPVMLWAAEKLGALAYHWVGRQREKALKHLRLAFGAEKTEPEIRRIAKAVFENLALTAGDILQFSKLDLEKLRRFVDCEEPLAVYRKLLEEGKGLISITAHLGNWELLAGSVFLNGLRGGVIARRIYYEPFNRWIVGLRLAVKVHTVYRDQSVREILKVLSRNGIAGILPDQDVDRVKGIFVPFFGRPAYTAVAPVKLALASGAPIVVSYLIRTSRERYRFMVQDVIRPKIETTREEAVRKYTALWTSRFEETIRQYPEQWAWMHDRWKTQPEKERTPSPIQNPPSFPPPVLAGGG